MKLYQWKSEKLRKEYKTYTYMMWLFGAITLVLLYVMPEDMKALNLIPLIIAMGCCVGWWNAQRKDKRLQVKK